MGAFQFDCAQVVSVREPIDETLPYFGNGVSPFYPTMQPDPEGNVTTVFNMSGPNIFATTAYISQRVTQPPGSFHHGGSQVVTGAATYAPAGQTAPLPWGDYAGVAPAGIFANSTTPEAWFSGMYVNASGNWNTTIGRNRFTAPNQP